MIHVEHRLSQFCYYVYVLRKHSGDRVSYLSVTPEGLMNWSPPEDGALERPHSLRHTYIIPDSMAQELLKGLTEVGVVNPPTSKIEGLYEAQGKHLADLQNIIRRLALEPAVHV